MRLLETSVYLGPNLYAKFPVIRLAVDLGELEQWPTGRLGAAFCDRLVDWLPGLKDHGCSYGEPGGFLRRMGEGEGTWLGHVLEHVAIELQVAAGADVSFGKTRSADGPGRYHVVFEYEHAAVGQDAGRLALDPRPPPRRSPQSRAWRRELRFHAPSRGIHPLRAAA